MAIIRGHKWSVHVPSGSQWFPLKAAAIRKSFLSCFSLLRSGNGSNLSLNLQIYSLMHNATIGGWIIYDSLLSWDEVKAARKRASMFICLVYITINA